MTFDYTIFDVTATPLTPLHIGSGKTLLRDYDFAVAKKRTWRINEDALLAAQDVSDPALADTLARTPPAQLLQPADFQANSPLFRYSLHGTPRSKESGAQLQEQIKLADDRVYLPGSSLKGAIRTALAWHGWQESNRQPTMRDLERSRKFAGRRIEQKIFGKDPNHDLLRALQVSDSQPAGKEQLILVNVQVLTKGGLQAPIELEAIEPDTSFKLMMKIDNRLLGDWARRNRLQLGGNPDWLTNLPQLIQAHTRQRLEDEMAWYKARSGAEQTAQFCQQLRAAELPANRCLLQMGWGTGWAGKTYGSHLQADQQFMDALVAEYRLSMGNKHQPGDSFPKSRRSIVHVIHSKRGQTRQIPTVPLGWLLLEMKEQK